MLYTIGHSNHTLEEFINILQSHGITHIVDVRTMPRSRHVPWFNKDKFALSLRKVHISYTHMPKLGGLRHTSADSINTAWRHKGFRGFADYMQTTEFFEGLKALNVLIKKDEKVAIMCAEAVPWRCHRSLIADAEIARHISVMDIMSKTAIKTHKLTAFARIDRNTRPIKVYYPEPEDMQQSFELTKD